MIMAENVQELNQDSILKELDRLGLSFSSEGTTRKVTLDPDKFYIAFINTPVNPITVDSLEKYFNGYFNGKGGIIFFDKKDQALEYSLDDLKAMKEG